MAGPQRATIPRAASSAGVRPSVRLVTPMTLLAQAVEAALRSRGLEVAAVSGLGRTGPRDPSEILVVLDDLSTAADVRRVLSLVTSTQHPVLVLTGRERGQYWGALVAAGATSIMSSAASVDEVVRALRVVHTGKEVQTPEQRAELLAQWHQFLRRQRDSAARLARLTERERTVLQGMAQGIAVPDQAAMLDVAEATVRSHVKSILRKLGVRSQLAAVALVQSLKSPLVTGVGLPVEPLSHVWRARTSSLGS